MSELDEAVMLLGSLVRAIKAWPADDRRVIARREKAHAWLLKYGERHNGHALRVVHSEGGQ